MTGQPDETRSEAEIRADLAATDDGYTLDKYQLIHALWRLRADVSALLADRSRLEQEKERLRESLEQASAEVEYLHHTNLDEQAAIADAARAEVTRLGRDLDEAEGLLRDWLVWGKAIADALGLNYDTDQERDERMIADAMRMRAAIDEAVRMCNGPGSAQSEASQVKKRVGGVLAAALGGGSRRRTGNGGLSDDEPSCG